MRAGFLQLRRVGATFRCGARASHCSGFSCCGARALGTWASVVVARRLGSCGSWALERRLSSCDTRAQLLRGMWDLPGPGIKPMSPALAGGFLTTAPPGKSLSPFLYYFKFPASVTSLPFLISLASTLVECMGVFWLLFVFLERNGSRTYKLYSLIFQLINFFLFRFVTLKLFGLNVQLNFTLSHWWITFSRLPSPALGQASGGFLLFQPAHAWPAERLLEELYQSGLFFFFFFFFFFFLFFILFFLKATMIAITKHETHLYYVIILTFSPVILHCNSSFTLQ